MEELDLVVIGAGESTALWNGRAWLHEGQCIGTSMRGRS